MICAGLSLHILAGCQPGLPVRPNVLFIAVDDLRPELGCYGNDLINTPRLDNLASEGCVFTHHFVAVPTCGASRYGLLTRSVFSVISAICDRSVRRYRASRTFHFQVTTQTRRRK